MRRIWAVGLICTLVACVLTGCSPAVEGISGIRLNTDDDLVAVLALCPGFGELTTIIMYAAEADGGVGDELVTLKRVDAAPRGQYVEVNLTHPPPGWHVQSTPTFDNSSQAYELRAWSEGGDNRVTSFPFRISELRDNSGPTELVLTKNYLGISDGVEQYNVAFLGPDEFRSAAQRQCSDG